MTTPPTHGQLFIKAALANDFSFLWSVSDEEWTDRSEKAAAQFLASVSPPRRVTTDDIYGVLLPLRADSNAFTPGEVTSIANALNTRLHTDLRGRMVSPKLTPEDILMAETFAPAHPPQAKYAAMAERLNQDLHTAQPREEWEEGDWEAAYKWPKENPATQERKAGETEWKPKRPHFAVVPETFYRRPAKPQPEPQPHALAEEGWEYFTGEEARARGYKREPGLQLMEYGGTWGSTDGNEFIPFLCGIRYRRRIKPQAEETPTPETDKEQYDGYDGFEGARPHMVVEPDFARTLERQRDAALAEAKHHKLMADALELAERTIKAGLADEAKKCMAYQQDIAELKAELAEAQGMVKVHEDKVIQTSRELRDVSTKLKTAEEERDRWCKNAGEAGDIVARLQSELESARIGWRSAVTDPPKESDGQVLFCFDDKTFGVFEWDKSGIADGWKDRTTFWIAFPPLPEAAPVKVDEFDKIIKTMYPDNKSFSYEEVRRIAQEFKGEEIP